MIFGLWKNLLLLEVVRVAGDPKSVENLAVITNEENPAQLCLGTIIDNSHLLTTCTCLKPMIQDIISGKEFENGTGLYFNFFDSENTLSEKRYPVDVLPYRYCKPRDVWPEAIEDFAILEFPNSGIILSYQITENWPFQYLDDDFENLIDSYENEGLAVSVWSNVGTNKKFEPAILSGALITKIECKKLLNCFANNPESLPPFDICRHFIKDPKANFRCLKLSEKRCMVNLVGAPVLVRDVVWGVSVRCVNDVNLYLALDRSFEFVFDKIKKYQSTGWFRYISYSIILIVVLIFGIASIIIFLVCHSKNKNYYY